jgi:ankyrin repeat protein
VKELASEDKDLREFSEDLWQECPLLCYAGAFWGVHARETEVSESIQECILTFLRDDDIRLFSYHAFEFYNTREIENQNHTTYIPALCITSIFGLLQITHLLLASGEVVSTGQKPHGDQALHYAAIYGHANVLLELLDNGGEVDALSDSSNTPLHFAALYGQSLVVETLLKNGAAVDAEDKEGCTATSLAERQGHFDVKDILVKHGGTTKGNPYLGLWGHDLEVVKQLSARGPELK